MAEKCITSLPPLRVTERLAIRLMKLAARDERALSDYIKQVLNHHAFGHGSSLDDEDSPVTDFGALHCDAGSRK